MVFGKLRNRLEDRNAIRGRNVAGTVGLMSSENFLAKNSMSRDYMIPKDHISDKSPVVKEAKTTPQQWSPSTEQFLRQHALDSRRREEDPTRYGPVGASSNDSNITHPPPLQLSPDNDEDPTSNKTIDLDGFSLAPPEVAKPEGYALERYALLLLSKTHLRIIFRDLKLLRKFMAFIVDHRRASVPLLVYHLDARKALAAIKYANAVTGHLKPLNGSLDFSRESVPPTSNDLLQRKVEESFERLANEDLPAWITYEWMKAVEVSIRRRINGSLPTQLRDMSEGLAETFVLTDPNRQDDPLLFTSEEFNKMTQFGNKHVVGRNCRMLQGPKTSPQSVQRIREKLAKAELHYEPILNYRRDGTPFMNLLMLTPLLDNNGKVRYFLGAQIDTSGLLKDFYGFEHLLPYADKQGYSIEDLENDSTPLEAADDGPGKGELEELCELFNREELEVVEKQGGRIHRPELREAKPTPAKPKRLVIATDQLSGEDEDDAIQSVDFETESATPWDALEGPNKSDAGNDKHIDHISQQHPQTNDQTERSGTPIIPPGGYPSMLDVDGPPSTANSATANFDAQHGGHLGGMYEHYLLVRPAPHLRILFASPSLRVPRMVQSNLMDRIGGSTQLKTTIEEALYAGQSVTAKVKWVVSTPRTNASQQGSSVTTSNPPLAAGGGPMWKTRWLHATPLMDRNDEVGVWMVVLVDEERDTTTRRMGGRVGYAASASNRSSVPSMPDLVVPSDAQSFKASSDSHRNSDLSGVLGQGSVEVDRAGGPDGLRPPPSSRSGNARFRVQSPSRVDEVAVEQDEPEGNVF